MVLGQWVGMCVVYIHFVRRNMLETNRDAVHGMRIHDTHRMGLMQHFQGLDRGLLLPLAGRALTLGAPFSTLNRFLTAL